MLPRSPDGLMKPAVRQLLLRRQSVRDSLVVWGDSTATMAGPVISGTAYSYIGNNWVQAGLHIAGHQLDVVNVGGNSGLRSDQIIPTFDAQVAAYKPKYVILPVGTNDIIQDKTAESTIKNLATMVSLCKGIGAVPVVMTVSCGETISANASQRAVWLAYNTLVRQLAAAESISCVDVATVYVDPATVGTTYAPLTGYTDGSVHPANKGAIKWGQAFATWLQTLPTRRLRQLAAGTHNAVPNPLFTGTSGTLNGATGQSPTGTTVSKSAGATVDSSIITRSDGVTGNWWQVNASMATGSDFLSLIMGSTTLAGSGFAVGDVVRCMCDVQVDSGHVNMLYASLRLRFTGSSGILFSSAFLPASASGGMVDPFPAMLFRTPEIPIPAGTTTIEAYLSFANVAVAAYSAVVRAGGPSITKV